MRRSAKRPLSTTSRMAAYRNRMRKAGLKPVQIWVPDPASPGFAAKCHKQSLAIARRDPAGAEALRLIEAAYEWPDA